MTIHLLKISEKEKMLKGTREKRLSEEQRMRMPTNFLQTTMQA